LVWYGQDVLTQPLSNVHQLVVKDCSFEYFLKLRTQPWLLRKQSSAAYDQLAGCFSWCLFILFHFVPFDAPAYSFQNVWNAPSNAPFRFLNAMSGQICLPR
jgi:hypothetical protein